MVTLVVPGTVVVCDTKGSDEVAAVAAGDVVTINGTLSEVPNNISLLMKCTTPTSNDNKTLTSENAGVSLCYPGCSPLLCRHNKTKMVTENPVKKTCSYRSLNTHYCTESLTKSSPACNAAPEEPGSCHTGLSDGYNMDCSTKVPITVRDHN